MQRDGAVGRVLHDVRLAHGVGDVAFVACGVSELNTTTLPAGTGTSTASDQSPQHSSPIGVERWASVPSPVHARHHRDAAVVGRRVGDRDPAREVRLRLDVGVAVVLVPQHRFGAVRLLVDRLVPVEAHVGADQIARQAGEHRIARRSSRANSVRVTACGATVCVSRPATEKRPPGAASRKRFDVVVAGCELGVELLERRRVERVLDHEVAELVELRSLRGRHELERARGGRAR